MIEVVGAAAPGIHDLVLGKEQFANIGQHDVVILDAPATGHDVDAVVGFGVARHC